MRRRDLSRPKSWWWPFPPRTPRRVPPSKPARIPAKVAEEEQRLEVAWQTACSFTVRVIAKRLEAAPASTSSGASPEGAHDFSLVSNESP